MSEGPHTNGGTIGMELVNGHPPPSRDPQRKFCFMSCIGLTGLVSCLYVFFGGGVGVEVV
jgi:hypothetical protein